MKKTHITTPQTAATHSPSIQTLISATQPTDAEVRNNVRSAANSLFFDQAKVALDNKLGYGAWLILGTAMHYLANLVTGAGVAGINGPEFKRYVTNHLPGYDAESLWTCMRCGFFHRGGLNPAGSSPVLKDVLGTEGGALFHDPDGSKNIQPGCIVLDIGSLLSDMCKSLDDILNKASTDAQIMNAIRWAHDTYTPATTLLTSPPMSSSTITASASGAP